MSRAKLPFMPEPRVWRACQVAARLGMSESTFGYRRKELEAQGFPRMDELLRGWDADAIERWLDARAGLAPHANDTFRGELEKWAG